MGLVDLSSHTTSDIYQLSPIDPGPSSLWAVKQGSILRGALRLVSCSAVILKFLMIFE